MTAFRAPAPSGFDSLPQERQDALLDFVRTLRDDFARLPGDRDLNLADETFGRVALLRGGCVRLLELTEKKRRGSFGLMAEALHNRDAMEKLGFRDGTAAVIQSAAAQILSGEVTQTGTDDLAVNVMAGVIDWIQTGTPIPAKPGTQLVPLTPVPAATPQEEASRALVLWQGVETVLGGTQPQGPAQVAADLRVLGYTPANLPNWPVGGPVQPVAQPAAETPQPAPPRAASHRRPVVLTPGAPATPSPGPEAGPKSRFNKRFLIPLAAAAGLAGLGGTVAYLLSQQTSGSPDQSAAPSAQVVTTRPAQALNSQATTPASTSPPATAATTPPATPGVQSDEKKANVFWSLTNAQFTSSMTRGNLKAALGLDTRQMRILDTGVAEQAQALALQVVQNKGGVLEGIPLDNAGLMADVTLTAKTLTVATRRPTGRYDAANQPVYIPQRTFSMPLGPAAQSVLAETEAERRHLKAQTEAQMVQALSPPAPFTLESAEAFVTSALTTLKRPGYVRDAVASGMFKDNRDYMGFVNLVTMKQKEIVQAFATSPEGATVAVTLPNGTEGRFSLKSDDMRISHFDPETGRVIERAYGPDVRERAKLKPLDPPKSAPAPAPAPTPATSLPGQKTAYRPS